MYEGTNNLWKYDPSLYDALVWYWKSMRWEKTDGGHITWAQLALDFQASTHEDLSREDKEPEDETIIKRAMVMRSASERLEKLFGEEVVPGGVVGHKQVGSLLPLGLPRATGISATPILKKKTQVDSILMEIAVQAKLSSAEPRLNCTPDLGMVGQPLWRHGEVPEEEIRRRIRGKQTPTVRTKRPRNLKVKNFTVLKKIKWTEEESTSISKARNRYERMREEKRHLHNRSRKDGTHRLATLIGSTIAGGDLFNVMQCELCGQRYEISYFATWPNKQCSGKCM